MYLNIFIYTKNKIILSYPSAPFLMHTFDPKWVSVNDIKIYQAVVFYHLENNVHVAMADPSDLKAQDYVTRIFIEQHNIRPKLVIYKAHMHDIQAFIKQGKNNRQKYTLDSLIHEGIRQKASDIHIQPQAYFDLVRMRVDGELIDCEQLEKAQSQTIINQLKIHSNVHLTESRRPQSGRFSTELIDIRTSFQATIFGESVAIRLLPKQYTQWSMSDVGFTEIQQATLCNMLKNDHGLIVCSGSTGAGKTTTLYSLLSQINPHEKNIMTLEDPVEYPLEHIRQTEIKPGVLDFADGVRALMRHDPDVILIGEIRDSDTAQMALRASMTGHLVLTTLHAHDVWSIPGRLIDFGLQPSLVAQHMLGAIHQKLVPKTCPDCNGAGCALCSETGRKGRSIKATVIQLTLNIKQSIAQNETGMELELIYEEHAI